MVWQYRFPENKCISTYDDMILTWKTLTKKKIGVFHQDLQITLNYTINKRATIPIQLCWKIKPLTNVSDHFYVKEFSTPILDYHQQEATI